MGTYGTSIFDDDIASDVREDFLGLLRQGYTPEESSKALLADWSESVGDSDDEPTLWLALAATQFEYGCLQDNVRQHAVAVIDDGSDLGRWHGKELALRNKELAELKAKLIGPQLKFRRPRKVKPVEPPSSHEALAPDGRGKAVAFNLIGADFMQVYLEREVNTSRGGGSVFVASCSFDDVELDWLAGPMLRITYPADANVQQKSEHHFFCGELIPVVYQTKQ